MTTFLTVPFSEKDQAKILGARWNAEKKKWYVPTGIDPAPFKKWGALDEAGASGLVGAPGESRAQAAIAGANAIPVSASKKTSMEEIGLTLTGDRYVERTHDCVPWLACDLCDLPGAR